MQEHIFDSPTEHSSEKYKKLGSNAMSSDSYPFSYLSVGDIRKLNGIYFELLANSWKMLSLTWLSFYWVPKDSITVRAMLNMRIVVK